MKKKSQKPYLTNYNLFIAQNLWQAHYQTLLIILLNEFIKLTANMDTKIKTESFLIKNKDRECCFQFNTTNVYVTIGITKKSLMKT